MVAATDALARCEGISVALLTQGRAGGLTVRSTARGVRYRVVHSRSRLALAMGLPMRQGLTRFGGPDRPCLVHSHGVWQPANHWAAWAARRWDVPLIIHPRGMLEPWALDQKGLKKRFALALFQRADLDLARVLVATSEMEYANLRRLGLRQPVAVLPNGVELPAGPGGGDSILEPGPRGGSQSASLGSDRERVLLFLSRVHPKKGLLVLVRAWQALAPAGWRLRIAGPDEDGHAVEVARLVEQFGLGGEIDLVGPVEGEFKVALYREADLFVLPTFSENFGVVVAEALAAGVPVITTRGAPWADLETYGCGWWIETGVSPLVDALRAATGLSDEARAAMGERGRVYVRRYDWDAIAGETVALYRWVLGQGDRPGCVRVD